MDREQAVPVYVQPPEPVPEPVREAVVPTPVVRRTGPPIRKLRRGPEPPLPVLAASRLFAAFDAMEQALDARADRLALAERAAERHRAAEAVAYAAWLRAQQAQRAAQQVADEVAQRLAAEQAAQDTLEFLMVWHLSVSDDL